MEEELRKQVEELVKQVALMAKTLQMTEENMNASSKYYQEKAARTESREAELSVLYEALKRSLNDLDGNVDDLATVTDAQTILYRAQQQQTHDQ